MLHSGMHRARWVIVGAFVFWVCGLSVGCAGPMAKPSFENVHRPYLLHLPGIGGTLVFDHWYVEALRNGGLDAYCEIYNWTCDDPFIHALQAYERNREQSKIVANMIATRRRQAPDAPIILSGQSGGTGISVFALEDLADGVMVDSVMLISPAVSPDYDLSRALRHVRGHMYVYSSFADVDFLGLGTLIFGTMDGVQTQAAGRIGFTRPAAGDEEQYKKLVSIPWRMEFLLHGDLAMHGGALAPPFARSEIAPRMLEEIRASRGAATMPVVQ